MHSDIIKCGIANKIHSLNLERGWELSDSFVVSANTGA